MWGAVIALGATFVANTIGQLEGQGQYEQAMQLRREAAQQWNIPLPQFDKVVAQTVQQDFSSPAARQAQLGALSKMQDIANQGGMDPQSQAAMMQAEAASGQQLRSNNAAIMANRAARGIGGSGDELSAELQGSQAANQNFALSSANSAAAARQRALQALSQSGQMAGSLRQGDLQQNDAEAALARFNAGMRTSATQYNNQLQQETFNDAATRAGGYANALSGVANAQDRQGDRYGNYGAAAGQAVGDTVAAAGYYGSQQPQQSPQYTAPSDEDLANWEKQQQSLGALP